MISFGKIVSSFVIICFVFLLLFVMFRAILSKIFVEDSKFSVNQLRNRLSIALFKRANLNATRMIDKVTKARRGQSESIRQPEDESKDQSESLISGVALTPVLKE